MPWRRRFALRAFGRPGFKPKLELRCKLGRDPGDGTPAAKLKHYPVERALRLPGELERERGLAAARLAVEQPHCRDPPRARHRASQAPRPGLRNRAVEAERKNLKSALSFAKRRMSRRRLIHATVASRPFRDWSGRQSGV
jgi:hypothetical protein